MAAMEGETSNGAGCGVGGNDGVEVGTRAVGAADNWLNTGSKPHSMPANPVIRFSRRQPQFFSTVFSFFILFYFILFYFILFIFSFPFFLLV